jgi:hypothetical protein
VDEPGVYFVILKGAENFKRWLSNPRDLGVAKYHTFAAGKIKIPISVIAARKVTAGKVQQKG